MDEDFFEGVDIVYGDTASLRWEISAYPAPYGSCICRVAGITWVNVGKNWAAISADIKLDAEVEARRRGMVIAGEPLCIGLYNSRSNWEAIFGPTDKTAHFADDYYPEQHVRPEDIVAEASISNQSSSSSPLWRKITSLFK